MAQLVYQTLVRSSKSSSISIMCMSPPRMLTATHRHGSNQSGKQQPQLIEVDLDSSSSSDGEVLGIKKLEDVIHNIIVKRSAPDWLPFIPGSSYWVPPPRARRRRQGGGGFVDILGKLTNNNNNPGLSDEESLSLSTINGWPSSSFYFFQENSSTRPVPVEMKVEVAIDKESDNEPQSEDEE